MSRFVRNSKYRHTYGSPAKKELWYENIKVSMSAFDSNLVTCNPKYIAVNVQVSGGGAFVVVPLDKPGKLPDIYPLVRGHTAPVLDTAWSPFDDDLVASGGEDSRVQLTRISRDALDAAWIEGQEVQDLRPLPTSLSHGGKKVGCLQWHPTASGVLASAAADIRLWDVEQQTAGITLQAHPDIVQSFSFNSTGALLATTCKDKKLRLFDVRASSSPVQVAESHSGVKGSRVCWLGNQDRIATTGFSRMSDRQVFLWNSGSLDKPIKSMTIDTSSGTLMPFWSDNNILFLAGKGDGNARYYELENDDLVYLSEYKSSEPQRGMTFLPRRALNVAECEIARAYKVASSGIEPISYIVPRKSDSFQSDIYPPAPSNTPAMSANDFFTGKTSPPIYIDLESGQTTSKAPSIATPAASPTKQPTRQTSSASLNASPSPIDTRSPASSVFLPKSTPREIPESPKDTSVPAPGSITPPPHAAASPPPSAVPQAKISSAEDILALKNENEKLSRQLVEATTMIRELELKVEKLTIAHRRAQEAYADI